MKKKEKIDLISIIVPVYKVEKYLNKCVDSIINQSYRNLEIILVDDGSPDNSGKMCDEYAKIDKRIKVIHKKNGGVSNARNCGLEVSLGEYVIFIDSDDWLENNMIEILYKNIDKDNYDMSICDYYINTDKKQIMHNLYEANEVILKREKMMNYLFDNKYYGGYLWNKLIRRNLIKQNNVLFNEDVKVCEDMMFLAELFSVSKKIIYSSEKKLYHYRFRNDSAVNFKYSLKDTTKLIPLKYFIEKGFLYKGIYYEYFILNCQSIYIFYKENYSDVENIIKCKDECNKYLKETLKSVNLLKKIKILLWNNFPNFLGKLSDKNK